MYDIAIHIYMLGVAVMSLFSKKVSKMWKGEHQTMSLLRDNIKPGERYVWFHAASLGEFEQGRPLMEELRARHPELKILLTFFSPSGYGVRKNYQGADIVCYLPLDTRRNARRFVETTKPVMAFFIKYEFWYNYLHELRRNDVPVFSVSSIFRPGQVFFRWYAKKYAEVLRCVTKFFVQNEESRLLLETLGITDVSVVGDTRFDRVMQVKASGKQLPIVDAFCHGDGKESKKLFVAGSSWMPDETIFMKYFEGRDDWKLIVAPHVISSDHIEAIEKLTQRRTVRYMQTTPEEAASASCLIIDCFGLLSSVYGRADVTYVGGGFGVGIHNVLEAAVWGVPVIFGPNNQRFAEARGLISCGGGYEIVDDAAFRETMDRLDSDDTLRSTSGRSAAHFVESKAGATDTILRILGL